MIGTLRGAVGIVVLGTITCGLIGPPRVRAAGLPSGTAELKVVQANEKFVNLLLNRNEAAIQHQLSFINRQNNLIALLPDATGNRLAHLCAAIDGLNTHLAAAKVRLANKLDQTGRALARLDALHPIHPNVAGPLANFELNAQARFDQEVQQSQGILNRPPATPCAPSGMNGMSAMVMATSRHARALHATAFKGGHTSATAERHFTLKRHK